MDNTKQSFSDKWGQNERLAFDETLREGSEIQNWILARNGFDSKAQLVQHLQSKRRVLDAGCGNGRVTALLRECTFPARTEIVGIDLVAEPVAAQNLAPYQNIRVLQRDLLGELQDLGIFDFIYCQEVLHHTADPHQAFLNLCSLLAPGGEIAIYVYKRKGPAREFVDGYVHKLIAGMAYHEAFEACKQLTAFGKALAECKLEVEVPAVDLLEIPSGRYDVQRFVYHFFCKCFWNPNLSFEENTAINYDWYHPALSSRHDVEEIRAWFAGAGLTVSHEYVDFYGITMRGSRG